MACTQVPVKKGDRKTGTARITFYHGHEDKYGSRVACSSKQRARANHTLAAERAFPFGTIIKIPWFGRHYVVEDRGSAVESRKASAGSAPVFDIYTNSRKEMKRLAAVVPPYLPYEIGNN